MRNLNLWELVEASLKDFENRTLFNSAYDSVFTNSNSSMLKDRLGKHQHFFELKH